MNTRLFFYALEIEKTGSITQAAENLYISQPTLSKSIKELEATLGFSVFRRSSKGVQPTTRGAEFLTHAQKIVNQIKKMELALDPHNLSNQLFSLAIPRVSYICQATSKYVSSFDNSRDMEIDILESSSMRIMDAVACSHYVLGIIRYHTEDEEYFLKSLEEKGLQYETLWEAKYVALVHQDHPLAKKRVLSVDDFHEYIQIMFGDDDVPYIRVSESDNFHGKHPNSKRILIYDRATQFDLLCNNPLTYMWVSPLPQELLQKNGLVQCKCANSGQFKDLLISRVGYRFSKLDKEFIDRLYAEKNRIVYGE